MNISRNFVRTIATTAAKSGKPTGEVHKGYFGLKNIQQEFQKPDGKPIHLKGGVFDQVLYRLTMGLSVVGLGGILKLIYDLSYPKPPE